MSTPKKTTSKTHGVFILDKSGSMGELRASVVSAFNEQVQQLRLISATQPTFASLITFNGDVEEVHWKQDINSFPEATLADYVPCGATALYDAMGYALTKLQAEDDGDTSYLVIIQSDGDTNQDRKFEPSAIRELVQSCGLKDCYTIVYIGCDEQVLRRVAQNTGIVYGNMAKMATSSVGGYNSSMSAMNHNLHSYAIARSAGVFTASVNFCSTDSSKIGDLTAETGDVVSGSVTGASTTVAPISPGNITLTGHGFLSGPGLTITGKDLKISGKPADPVV